MYIFLWIKRSKPYQKLVEHFYRLPGGFGTSDSGADLRLLRRLFMPKEAELTTYLTLNIEPVEAIAKRAQFPVAETAHRLNKMAKKGLIFSVQSDEGPIHYQAAPWFVGIYEFQVNRMN